MVSAPSPTEKGDQLPSYLDLQNSATSPLARGAYRTKHLYSLETTKRKPWLSLSVSSRAVSARVLPVFRDGDEISGEVKVDLDKPESYKGISVKVSSYKGSPLYLHLDYGILQDCRGIYHRWTRIYTIPRLIHHTMDSNIVFRQTLRIAFLAFRNFSTQRSPSLANSKGNGKRLPTPSSVQRKGKSRLY